MTIGLTRRQKECLDFIKAENACGKSPTYAAIAAAMGLKSKGHVRAIVKSLQERGHVVTGPQIKVLPNYFKVWRIDGEAVLVPMTTRKAVAA